MPVSSGPRNTAKSNLVFALDTYDTSNCVTPLGCGGWNNSTQGIKNILTGVTALFQNGLRVSNRTFYTAFGISYPEGNYGGAAANRDGLTQGYNVLSGGKTYGASRSLNVYVWNNNTNAWVPDSYFGGLRIDGHCYDNYAGAESGWQNQLNIFNANYATIKQAFPNTTWIIVGSHACQMFDNTTINNMVDLGAPRSTISSWTDGSAWREFVLVGTPGLGDSKAYGWAYENYSVNPAQVANMNLSVTPKATGVLNFDGTDDYLSLAQNNAYYTSNWTWELVTRFTGNTGTYQGLIWAEGATGGGSGYQYLLTLYNNQYFHYRINNVSTGWGFTNTSNINFTPTNYNHIIWQFSGGLTNIYINGSLFHTNSTRGTYNGGTNSPMFIGSRNDVAYTAPIDLGVCNFYSNVLSSTEIQNNYRQYKTRFNLA